MSDVISTLALRISSADAINNLRAVAQESEALSGVTDQLKGKILSVVSAYASWRFGKVLLADAAEGQEALGKFETVMGRFGDKAAKIVDELTAKFNYDATSARGALSGMVDTFAKAGVSLEQSLDMATLLNKRAADIEAFTNAQGGVAHIAEQMTSGVLGNTMAVRSLGIVLSAEAIQAQMAKEKMQGLTFASERAAKMHASVSVMLQQSASAEGQVARESDNYSNRLRYLNARLADLRSSLGEALIPTMTKVVEGGAALVDTINNLSPSTKNLIVGVGALSGVLLTIGPTVLKVAAGFKTISVAKALETMATKKETVATTEETGAMVAQNTVAATTIAQSEAITAAKTIEAAARTRNAQAMAAENLAGTSKPFQRFGMDGAMQFDTKAPSAKTGKFLSESSKELGKFNSGLSGILTTLGSKLGVVKNFASGVMRVFGVFGKAPGYVALVVGSLEVLKHAPQWIEVAFDKLPDVFASLGSKSIAALKNFGATTINWGKDLVVGGLLGAAQTGKRLLGMETAASREYKLNKQIEANNKKREALLESQQKQLAAENALLSSRQTIEQSKSNALLGYNESRETDAMRLTRATALRDQKNNEIIQAENNLAELQRQLASGGLTDAQKDEIAEKSKSLAEQLGTLHEEWKNAALDVDKLSESVENATKAFEDNQKSYERSKLNAAESFADAEAQNLLSSANTHRARQNALLSQRNKAQQRLDEAQAAQGEADSFNEQAKALQGQLQNDKAMQALLSLSKLAESGDISEAAMLQYSGAQELLKGAGYGDIVEGSYGFGAGSAMNLLRDITDERKRQQKELDSLLTQRDEKQELANEAGSRLSAYNQAQRSMDEEDRAFNEQLANERRQNEENERRRAKANRGFYNQIDETYFNRQLQASDQFYGKDAFGAAMSRYNLIGGRGSQEWSASMSAIAEQQKLIDEINKQLEPLNKQFNEGTLTDDDAKERERLLAQRAQFEEEMQSDYQSAVMKRLQTEDTLLSLESSMREEYLKNIQNYVNEEGTALRERLQAEAEMEKKRMEELSKVQEEARQAVYGQRAIAAGSSEAFNLASRIYDRGRENLPTEKKIENSTKQIEEYVKVMQEQMMAYFTEQSGGMTLSFGY